MEEREHLRDLGIDGRFHGPIKMDLKDMRRESVDWIHLSQDRVQWRGLVNAVLNIGVP
jgi:hypothetical protein